MSLPPLILIHGYPFDHSMWQFVVAALSHQTRVLTPDLSGFGDNPVDSAEPSIDQMADDIAKFFDFHNIKQAVVAGMSMGGYVALSFAERHKERLAGLALISTQSNADLPENQKARRELIEKVRREGTARASEAILPKLFSAANRDNPALARFAIEGAEKAGVAGICWALEAMARRPDRSAVLTNMTVPTTVIHGAEDQIVPTGRARTMAEATPNGIYIEIPGVGHASPLEAGEQIADALLELLQRTPAFLNRNPVANDNVSRNRPGIIWSPTERGL